jgi:thiosulfate/3-mercaptopyruvate sulfurtransferase
VTAPSSPLVTVSALHAELAGPDRPVVLDVRYRLGGPPGRPDHDAAHIPGAVFADLDTELAAAPGAAGRHPLPEPARLQDVLRRAGIRAGSRVVAHDDGNGSIAARAWWLLRWAGFPAERVAVLDGGWAAWLAAGLPTSAEPSQPEPGDITVRPGGMPVIDAGEAAALAGRGVLLDARAAARYRGEVEPVDPRAGHIPGAHNVPTSDLVAPDGSWLAPAELAERFAAEGVEGTEVAAYCGSGVTATALVLGVERAGLRPPERPIALYVGSWSNWSADPARPVAVGPEP